MDFECVNDALGELVLKLGGHKKVGPMLWPELLPPEQAAQRLRDCLNPDRREKLSPEQVVLLLRLASRAGYHCAMCYVTSAAGYESPRPVKFEDQDAELQSKFVEAVERLEQLQKLMQRNQQIRRAA